MPEDGVSVFSWEGVFCFGGFERPLFTVFSSGFVAWLVLFCTVSVFWLFGGFCRWCVETGAPYNVSHPVMLNVVFVAGHNWKSESGEDGRVDRQIDF